MPSLRRDGELFVLDLGEGHNRFNGEFVASFEACLDEVEAAAPCALVTTARGKVFSNGLDLEWMATQGDAAMDFLARVHELLARVLEIGVPTVAAMQGHTYAAGAMLALAHDQRVMRSDRGWFCLPEVDMGIAFTPGMTELLASRLPSGSVHEAVVLGRRYGGAEAAAEGIVDEAVSERERAEPRLRACRHAVRQAARDDAHDQAAPLRPHAGRSARSARRGRPRGGVMPGAGLARCPGVVRHWGSTPTERAEAFPCDGLLAEAPLRLYRAVGVEAPSAVVFRWLCQLRAAPYSYDLIDNGARRSPQTLTPGLDHLEPGQRFMRIFRLVEFEPGRSVTLRSSGTVFGDVVVSYRVRDVERDARPPSSRLVAKLLVAPGAGPLGSLPARALLAAGDLVMMRRQLLNIARLAERDAAELAAG